MKTMLWPSSASRRRTWKISSVSCGVRTAVGSSSVAIERLEDLDALLPTDRERADLRLGVDLEAEPPAELDDPAVRLRAIEEVARRHRLVAEHDVLGHGQDGDQHEVLVDHVDPAVDGVGWTGEVHHLPVEQDLALVRACEPVEDVHQRRLARAVLAEEGVDLARAHIEVDVVVGDDAGIPLGDAAHLQRGRVDDLGRERRGGFGSGWGLRCHRCLVCAVTLDMRRAGRPSGSTRSSVTGLSSPGRSGPGRASCRSSGPVGT